MDDVALLGISMGGYLCLRAAAFSPLKLHYKQLEALKNAQSVTGRIFTKKEQAHKHCQIGNIRLALDVMANWVDEKS